MSNDWTRVFVNKGHKNLLGDKHGNQAERTKRLMLQIFMLFMKNNTDPHDALAALSFALAITASRALGVKPGMDKKACLMGVIEKAYDLVDSTWEEFEKKSGGRRCQS